MKQFFKILALAALALPFTGCDVEYDPIVVQPDVALEDSGMTTVHARPYRGAEPGGRVRHRRRRGADRRI
jgi:hypothetical protein